MAMRAPPFLVEGARAPRAEASGRYSFDARQEARVPRFSHETARIAGLEQPEIPGEIPGTRTDFRPQPIETQNAEPQTQCRTRHRHSVTTSLSPSLFGRHASKAGLSPGAPGLRPQVAKGIYGHSIRRSNLSPYRVLACGCTDADERHTLATVVAVKAQHAITCSHKIRPVSDVIHPEQLILLPAAQRPQGGAKGIRGTQYLFPLKAPCN
jgi:hypothetical protein